MYKTCCRRPVCHRYKWHLQIFFGSLAQSDLPLSSEQCAALSETEVSSFGNNEQLLDTEIAMREEIEKALKNLKLGKSVGLDGLSPEPLCMVVRF